MPKMCSRSATPSAAISYHLANGPVEVAPLLALAHHGLEVFLQDDLVLHGVLDDGAHEIGGKARCVDGARAEMASLGPSTDGDRDGFRRRQRTRWRFEFEFAIERLAIAQLAEDGDDAGDLLVRRLDPRQLQAAADLRHALDDDLGLLLEIRRQRQYHHIEASLQ